VEANLGLLALAEPEAARRHLLAAAEAARVAGPANVQLRVLGNLAIVEWRLGRYEEAVARHRDTLALARRAGDLDTQAVALGNLSAAARWLGRADEALATAEEAAALAARLGSWPLLESMRHARAEMLAAAGRLSDAAAELDGFEPRTRSGEVWHAIRRADVAVRAGLPEEARRHLERAEALLASPGDAPTDGDPAREIAALRAASDAAGS
jgi:tetratricopeptide (TPR) repeat protein